MPNASHISSSVLATRPEEEQTYTIAPETDDITTAPETEGNDWFYGTEELLDALPKLWTRSLLYFLVAFSAIALPWAMLSKVDETGSARGRIEPKGATLKLDSQVGGSVTAVKVKEGQVVKAGQLLVELESDVLRTDLQQAETRLEGLQNQRSQMDVLKNQLMLAIRVQEQQNKSQELEKLSQVNQAQQNLDAKQSTYNLQKLQNLAQVDQAQQNIDSTNSAHKIANSRFNRDVNEVTRYSQLVQEGAIPQTKVVELEKEAEESQQLQEKAQSDVKQAQLRLKEEQSRYKTVITQAEAEIKQAKLRLEEQKNSYQTVVHSGKLALLNSQEQLKNLQAQISNIQSQIAQTRSQITSFKIQLQQRRLRAPVDGMIYQLPVGKPGAVVQAGQLVAQIAPKETPFVVKAHMPSQQSGFLKVGMPVKVKFDAYPFQDYGVVEGRVNWISPDSKVQETQQGKIETYELEITLKNPYIQNGNKQIRLTPGQTATAEVIVRQRRVIDFMLDPFKKLQKGGLEL